MPLRRSGTHDATSPVALDAPGLDLRALAGLPEGAYEATLEGTEVNVCRFAVAEYRLAPHLADLDGSLLESSLLASASVDRAIRLWEGADDGVLLRGKEDLLTKKQAQLVHRLLVRLIGQPLDVPAQPWRPGVPRFRLALFVVLSGLDLLATYLGVEVRGLEEENPLARLVLAQHGFLALILYKSGVVSSIVLGVCFLMRRSPIHASLVLALANVVTMLAVLSNVGENFFR